MVAFLIFLSWHVWVLVNGHPEEVQPETTASEVKPGWKIVDIQLKSHTVRYLWGVSAMQLMGRQDTLVIDPGEEVLSDFILVPLRKKAQYRRFKEEKMDENPYTVLDMHAFDITPWGDDAFRVTPRVPLKPGEYVIHCLKSDRVGERGDYEVYPISVK